MRLNELQISTIEAYFSKVSRLFNFRKLPDNWWEKGANIQFIDLFLVSRLNTSLESPKLVNKCQVIEVFLSFLLELLYHDQDPIVKNLENELRCVLTILGDISWILLDSLELQDRFLTVIAEFESVANQVGGFLHSFLFSTDDAFQDLDKGLAVVLDGIEFLKATIKSCDFTRPVFAAPKIPTVNSLLILDSLIDNLQDLLEREDNHTPYVKDQINILHRGLIRLRDNKHSEIEERPMRMGIGNTAHQAEYLITAYLVKDAPLWYVIARLTDLNRKIEIINMELQVITETYKLGGLKVTEYHTAQPPLQGESIKNEAKDIMVGFEYPENDILDLLLFGGRESRQVISILGMGGIGKTTLAKQLYNHPLVRERFHISSWVVVSQIFDTRSILTYILIHLNDGLDKDTILCMTEESLVELIYRSLEGRRYLFVMDDVWDSTAWNELQRCFPDDGNRSRILLTSRTKDVAPADGIIYQLPFLTDEQCWELLQMKVFGIRTCPAEMRLIGKKIAAGCCGLPLAVVIISGVLSTMHKDKNTWDQMEKSFSFFLGQENSATQILELSYNHLPNHLKACFLYFGAFKDILEFPVGKLKRFWIAEGFIRRDKEKSRESVAEEYLMELIDRSLVMVAKRSSDGRVKTCVVHDLLRHLCLKKCKEVGFLQYSNNKIYVVSEEGHHPLGPPEVPATLSINQHVRTFYGDRLDSSFYVRDMRLLRVLNFNYIGDGGRLFGLEYLVNLRLLVTGEMPACIEKLVNLEYLRVISSRRVYLPPTIEKLKRLIYIKASEVAYGKDWNSCCNNSLESFSGLTIEKLKDEELNCSPHLRKLKCTYEVVPSELDEKEYPKFDLSFLTQLHSLSLSFRIYERFKLHCFRFPPHIRKLSLWGSRFHWENMSIVGSLENLEVLTLSTRAFDGERWKTRDGEFKKLRELKLERMSLSVWEVDSGEHFPNLRQLKLEDCYTLKEIPCAVGEIQTLESIHVKGKCTFPLVESAEKILKEQREMGDVNLKLIMDTIYYDRGTLRHFVFEEEELRRPATVKELQRPATAKEKGSSEATKEELHANEFRKPLKLQMKHYIRYGGPGNDFFAS